MIGRLWIALFVAGMLWLPASVIAQETDTGVIVHVVQRGENLFRIALNYGVSVQELASLNSIVDPSNIQVGQRLLVPSNNVSNLPETHVVQPGETLRSIAQFYNVTIENLISWNNIASPDTIYVGQILNLAPAATEAPTAEPSPLPEQNVSTQMENLIHIVQSGETLFRIAMNYGLTVNELARANNITDPTLIYAGQQIIIPGVEKPQLALELPPSVSHLDITPLVFVEGQTGRVRLVTNEPMSVNGVFLDREITSAAEQNNTQHTILVGIPVFTEPGVYPLSLTLTDLAGKSSNILLNIQLVSGNYGSEYINLLTDRSNLLDPNIEAAEQNLLQSIMSAFTPDRYWDGPLGLPAAASVISPFGRRRSFNGGPFDHFHSGTDFGGSAGTPILVAAPGIVAFVGPLDIRGNATIVDHGWGVYTGYWHQTAQHVSVGDFVSSGQVIGTIGATGRVSGPHLHWELWVNGVPVDPMQWVRQSFS